VKKVAFIFPGQGSQAVGMGKDFYENSPLAKELIDSVSESMGIDFPGLMFVENGDLEKTQFTQPAILLISLVAKELFLKEIDITPHYLLGHSLGEFSALATTGAVSTLEAVQLVHTRGKLMQEACSGIDAGMMAVIGLSNDVVNSICEEARSEGRQVWGANYNSNGQVVIAGIKSDLEYIQPKLKEAKAKRAIILNMSVASHCPLLESATEKLRDELDRVVKDNFSTPIVSNVTAQPYSSKSEAVELLTKQLVSPVKYEESIRNIADEVDIFIEFGHGAVLKGLNRRIVKSIPTLTISDMESLEKAIKEIKE